MLDGDYGDDLSVTELLRRKEVLLQIMVSERNADTAIRDDLLQEARIAVWRASDRPHDSDAYLHTAARHRIAEARDRQTWTGHTGVRGHTDVAKTAVSLDALADLGEAIAAVEPAYHHGEIAEALDALTPAQRTYVRLRFWEGYGTAALADHFGYDPGALWRGKGAARDRLRSRLAHLVAP